MRSAIQPQSRSRAYLTPGRGVGFEPEDDRPADHRNGDDGTKGSQRQRCPKGSAPR